MTGSWTNSLSFSLFGSLPFRQFIPNALYFHGYVLGENEHTMSSTPQVLIAIIGTGLNPTTGPKHQDHANHDLLQAPVVWESASFHN